MIWGTSQSEKAIKKKKENGRQPGHGLGRKEFEVEAMTPSHICEHEHTERLQMSSQQRTAQSRSHQCELQVHWLSIAPKNSESSVARSSLKGSQVAQSEETHLPH